jgi:hypothetical protein
MHALQVRRTARALRRTILTVIASALVALALAPSASAKTTPSHLTVLHLDFTSYSCRVDEPLVCDVTITGPVKSNLSTTEGIAEYTVVLTWEGFEGSPCNTVDETTVFTFDTGTITTHSVHRDCPATILPGPRIQSSFTVIGGTGAFEGARGSGREVGGGPPVVYNGTIDF